MAGNTSDSGGGDGTNFAFNNTGATFTGNIVISGPGNLVKTDAGTVILTNTNNYGGDTTVGFNTYS